MNQQKIKKSLQLIYQKRERGKYVFVAERFMFNLLEEHCKHPISTDGRTAEENEHGIITTTTTAGLANFGSSRAPYPYTSFEKSIIERTIQYIKDRTIEGFDDYFHCRKKRRCKLKHVLIGLIC